MSDPNMMPRGMGGMPGGSPDAIKQNMSIFNPTDALLMGKSGQMSEEQPIRDFFSTNLGLDVDKNTMGDLRKKVGEQVQNANPMNKMKNMAKPGIPPGQSGPGMPTPPVPVGGQGNGGQTLDDLMKG